MSEEYEKLTQREHIIKRPDSYVGSIETNKDTRWTNNADSNRMNYRSLQFNPGLYKIYDEILVNARDAFVRSSGEGRIPVKKIDITVSGSPTVIEVVNDGDGIPNGQDPDYLRNQNASAKNRPAGAGTGVCVNPAVVPVQ